MLYRCCVVRVLVYVHVPVFSYSFDTPAVDTLTFTATVAGYARCCVCVTAYTRALAVACVLSGCSRSPPAFTLFLALTADSLDVTPFRVPL